MMVFLARPRPTICANLWVPPLPGIVPRPISGSPIWLLSVAITKSQASASSNDTPSANFSIAAITGLRARSGAAI